MTRVIAQTRWLSHCARSTPLAQCCQRAGQHHCVLTLQLFHPWLLLFFWLLLAGSGWAVLRSHPYHLVCRPRARHVLGYVEHCAQPGWLCCAAGCRRLRQGHGLEVGHVGTWHHRPRCWRNCPAGVQVRRQRLMIVWAVVAFARCSMTVSQTLAHADAACWARNHPLSMSVCGAQTCQPCQMQRLTPAASFWAAALHLEVFA